MAILQSHQVIHSKQKKLKSIFRKVNLPFASFAIFVGFAEQK